MKDIDNRMISKDKYLEEEDCRDSFDKSQTRIECHEAGD